jgi:hypothetical protein
MRIFTWHPALLSPLYDGDDSRRQFFDITPAVLALKMRMGPMNDAHGEHRLA